ncbi:hypothetical protein K457DRAFT_32829 [Linnemannia elongata AG-77]|uniref:Uncharacterized protein n=1 Tax=Linnemannia elongata AG-77 TaxID=1314771 RepID=A0A197JWW1_9FUNG|nr:hypothetical protein K457DRAFT_32829 [Linnemannia elongata AG-77]
MTIATTTTTTTTKKSALTTPKQIALSIPEVLKHFLSFFTRKDRQDPARLIGKVWHAICKDLLPNFYAWILRINLKINIKTADRNDRSDSHDEQDIRDLVSLANNIIVQIDSDSQTAATSQQRLVSWKNMVSVLSSITRERTSPWLPEFLDVRKANDLSSPYVFLEASPRLSKLVLAHCDHLKREGQNDAHLIITTRFHNQQGTRIIHPVGAHCPDFKIFHLALPHGGYSYGLGTLKAPLCWTAYGGIQPERSGSPGAAGYTKRITTMNLLPCRSDAIHIEEVPLVFHRPRSRHQPRPASLVKGNGGGDIKSVVSSSLDTDKPGGKARMGADLSRGAKDHYHY